MRTIGDADMSLAIDAEGRVGVVVRTLVDNNSIAPFACGMDICPDTDARHRIEPSDMGFAIERHGFVAKIIGGGAG